MHLFNGHCGDCMKKFDTQFYDITVLNYQMSRRLEINIEDI